MTQFFINIMALGPLDVLQAQTNSITGGKTKANADEHSAPINERKWSNFGTISEMATVNWKWKCLLFVWNEKTKIHLHVSKTINTRKSNCVASGYRNGPCFSSIAAHMI